MFEAVGSRREVAEGSASPLACVPHLESLTDDELLLLDADAALAVVELVQSATTALAAVQALAVEALTRREEEQVARLKEDYRRRGRSARGCPTGEESATATLAQVFHVSPRSMGAQLCETRTLVNAMPQTFTLVRAGRLDLFRARAAAAEGGTVSRDRLDAFDDALVHPDRTPDRTRYRLGLVELGVGALRKRAARVAVSVDPESAATRARDAQRERFVRVTPGVDPGVTSWSASLEAGASLKAWAAVDALAAQYVRGDSSITVGQARADAMADLILANATVRTTVDLVVPVPALVGVGGAVTTATVTPEAVDTTTPGAALPGATLCSPGLPDPASPDPASPGPSAPEDGPGTLWTWPPVPQAPPAPDDPGTRPESPVERHLRLVVRDGRRLEVDVASLHPCGTAGPSAPPVPHSDHAFRLATSATSPASATSATSPASTASTASTASAASLVELARLAEAHEADAAETIAAESPTADAGSAPAYAEVSGCLVGVQHPRVGIILTAALTALLADPDTRVRLHGSDPTSGAVVVHDPRVYRPNERLARIVRARDQHCRFPGCATDARRCQLDHVVRFPDGPTAVDNLACLCSTHHAFKHHSGWRLSIDDAGTCTWVSPRGRTYVTTSTSASELAA